MLRPNGDAQPHAAFQFGCFFLIITTFLLIAGASDDVVTLLMILWFTSLCLTAYGYLADNS
jgi:hypothetical protein